MRRRHHYATTGNRALLSVTVELASDAELFERDPAVGPREVRANRGGSSWATSPASPRHEVDLVIEVVGSAPIERLDIFDGLDLIETIRPYMAQRSRPPRTAGLSGRRVSRPGAHDDLGRLAHRRRQPHRARRRDQQLEPRSRHPEQDASTVTWKAVTTGNYGAIDLWLETAAAGAGVQDRARVGRSGDRGAGR